ncbi:Tol-Pal system protein TolB [Rhodobacterales bacterium HKCCE3408]|nr:Tol-Pal system protein TolB [Rhodobacterales bacterium HKCCE3408]
MSRLPLRRILSAIAIALLPAMAAAQDSGPLRIEITEGVVEPLPFAIPTFIAETGGAADAAQDITRVIAADLRGTGLFREIPAEAHISTVTNFSSPVQYADWRAINAQALITGSVEASGNGQIIVRFRLFDVVAGQPLGDGLQFVGGADSWRRMAHAVADQVYERITGESGYFDTRVAFIAEDGPKNARLTRLAIMDYDGANVQYLSDSQNLVLAPRFSPDGGTLLFTRLLPDGTAGVFYMDLATIATRPLAQDPGTSLFTPRFSPDGGRIAFSISEGGNSDIFIETLASGQRTRLTSSPSIEASPSFSPDGSQIVFESDRTGTQQLYVMPATGGEPTRISRGSGRYGTPVWSPRGDLIAFTYQAEGRFHIGVMRTDGTGERLLTSSFLDEGPTWAPNGRVIMFTRETAGADGAPALYSVDISGRNLQRVAAPGMASDPDWGPQLSR